MKTPSLLLPFVAAATLVVITVGTVAQAPQAPQNPTGAPSAHQGHHHPAPTNLKVLPKDLTGEQVHEIMERWADYLGAECNTCHTADPKNIAPNGKPRLNFADDSKPEKSTARLMFRMTEDINQNYVSMVPNSGAGVTCGTCHRGHISPQPFVAPDEKEQHPPQQIPKPEQPH